MHRQAAHQLDLPLGIGELPEPLLRAAYARCELEMSFDKAMEKEVLRICFRAMARNALKEKKRIPSRAAGKGCRTHEGSVN